VLEARGLVKSWPGFSLGLDLRLAAGEIAAVLGPSGCGKSTLLRLLSGLESPDSGRILLAGRDITAVPPEKRGIGMVFQDFALFPHMSVRRNIEYGPRMLGLPRRARMERAEALASSFEIGALLERSPYSLSGGEQQRVALARALAAGPSIVLLDEPLSSLDASLRRRLRSEIAGRLREAGISAILVTHDAEEALAVADRVLLLRDGRVESEGDPEGLYDAPPTAWSASFLGRGPLLEILSIETAGDGLVARTPIGPFRCRRRGLGDGAPASLFFPSEAPRSMAPRLPPEADGPANRVRGRVESSLFAGRFRRVTLACALVAGEGRGGTLSLELELPSSSRAERGDELELEIPPDDCFALY
jgi:iron(III) transport system ATP-binding protein